MCNRTNTFLGPIAACAVHLTRNGGSRAQDQATTLLFGMSTLYPGIRKWAGGDFNLRVPFSITDPDRIVPPAWYDNYYEGDPAPFDPTTDTGIKIDHVFGAKNTFTGTGSSDTFDVPSSDHRYYWTTFVA
jgi:hypothetical protein